MAETGRASVTRVPQAYTISLKLLGGFIIAYLLGVATHLLARNFFSGQPLTFSTPELINFVLSVLLSGASIFLAIAAIALGRFSEQAIIDRSDESIRLQNEVFQKTTDALQRIESSTGVTEKRIEDIIAGRVGDLSQRAARIATEAPDAKGKDMEELIRKSLYEALREEGGLPQRRYLRDLDLEWPSSLQPPKDPKREEYKQHSNAFLQALALRPNLKAIKIGRGDVSGVGDDALDGIYQRTDGTRIGITDFAAHHKKSLILKGITTALRALHDGYVSKLFVVFYGPKEEIEQVFNDAVSLANDELKSKVSLVICPPEDIPKVAAALPID